MPQRIAIVTGAARGIGAGTAKRLAGDGMAVAVLDLGDRKMRERLQLPPHHLDGGEFVEHGVLMGAEAKTA